MSQPVAKNHNFFFQSDPRYLFLISLNHEKGNWHRVAQLGEHMLSYANIIGRGEDKKEEPKIDLALAKLREGIVQEQVAEKAYVTNLLNKIKSIKNDKIKDYLYQIEDIFSSEGSIDYLKLITIINTILTGTNTYKNILSLEQKRIDELEKGYKAIKQSIEENPRDIKMEAIKDSNGKVIQYLKKTYTDGEEYIRETYLDRHRMRDQDSGYFKNVDKTIDNFMAKIINTVIEKYFNQGKITSIKDANDFINNFLMKRIVAEISKIQKFAEKTEEERENIIITQMQKDMDAYFKNHSANITTNITNAITKEKKSKKTVGYKTKDEETIFSGRGVAERIEELISKIDLILADQNETAENNEFIAILNTRFSTTKKDDKNPGREAYNKLKEAYEAYKNDENGMTTVGDVEMTTRQALTKARASFGHFFIRATKRYMKNNQTSKEAVIDKINQILNSLQLSVSGSDLSEIISAVFQQNQDLYSLQTGKSNHRADVMTVQVKYGEYSSMQSTKNLMSGLPEGLAETYVDTFQEQISKKLGDFDAAAFSLEKGKQVFLNASEAMQKYAESLKIDGALDETFDIANWIKNTVVISETMKTFNTYNNNLGFVNGSMGPTLAKQVENFAELFNAAGVGMSAEEQQLLIFALVNCSSAALGADQRSPLEKYLSTLAGFAIFDEGSAELEKLNTETMEKYSATPQIMHLYRLNGIYFPGSFILERIYQQLTETVQDANGLLSGNDGVKINATADDRLVDKSSSSLQARWNTTYGAALNATSIEVTFISQLLNIIKQLNSAFENI